MEEGRVPIVCTLRLRVKHLSCLQVELKAICNVVHGLDDLVDVCKVKVVELCVVGKESDCIEHGLVSIEDLLQLGEQVVSLSVAPAFKIAPVQCFTQVLEDCFEIFTEADHCFEENLVELLLVLLCKLELFLVSELFGFLLFGGLSWQCIVEDQLAL